MRLEAVDDVVEEFTWKVGVLFRKVNFVAVAVVIVAAIVLYLAAPLLAPALFGARGDLLALALEWLATLLLAGMFAAFGGIVYLKLKARPRWLGLAGALLFGGICLYAGAQTLLSTADLALHFSARDVVIARTYYEHPQAGRGALPETGGWHLVTTNGDDYTMGPSGDGDRVRPGAYRLELSRPKHLVMQYRPE